MLSHIEDITFLITFCLHKFKENIEFQSLNFKRHYIFDLSLSVLLYNSLKAYIYFQKAAVLF